MALKAVSDTGPILHLSEIQLLKSLAIFSKLSIPSAVEQELQKHHISLPSRVKVINLGNLTKDNINLLMNQYELDLGEASAIVLSIQEKADYFLTDDLEARNVAKKYYLKVHGTAGIILRAFREGIIKKEEAITKVRELKTTSSLFITENLIQYILSSIERFSNGKQF